MAISVCSVYHSALPATDDVTLQTVTFIETSGYGLSLTSHIGRVSTMVLAVIPKVAIREPLSAGFQVKRSSLLLDFYCVYISQSLAAAATHNTAT